MTVYERIETLRKSQNISQGKLEQELGFSNGSISKWRNSMPTPERLQKIAEHFGVSTDYLLGKNDVEPITKRLIECLRDYKELTEDTICQDLQIEPPTWHSWCNGTYPASLDSIHDAALFYELSADYLLFGTGSPFISKTESTAPISAEDSEWLSLIHQLPTEAQYEFRGEIKGYLKRMSTENPDPKK